MDTPSDNAAANRRFLPFAALLVTMVSVQFGAAYSKQLFPVLGVERTTFIRSALGALLMAPFLRPWKLRVPAGQWPLLLLFSAALGAMNLCFYLAIQRIPLGIAVALEFIGPLGLAICMSHRRIDVLWVVLAVIGMFLLLPITQSFRAGSPPLDGVGVLYALLAAVCWAAYSVLAQRIGKSQGNGIIALAMAIAALMLLPVAAVQPGTIQLTPQLVTAMCVVALFSSALPYSLEMIALTGMPIRVYGTFTSLDPVMGTLMGLLILRELPTGSELLGISAIVVASLGAALCSD